MLSRWIAALGTAADLDAILSIVGQEPGLLEALAEGATTNAAIPEAGTTVVRFLTSETPPVRIAAARLAGRWKVAGGGRSPRQEGHRSRERGGTARHDAGLGELRYH